MKPYAPEPEWSDDKRACDEMGCYWKNSSKKTFLYHSISDKAREIGIQLGDWAYDTDLAKDVYQMREECYHKWTTLLSAIEQFDIGVMTKKDAYNETNRGLHV